MKLFKIIFFSFAAVVGAYSAFWYIESNALEKILKLHIDQLNLEGEGEIHLEYASFEKGGYPFEISVAMLNPKITVASPTEVSTEASVLIHTDGKMIDHFSPLGQLKSFEYVGKTHVLIPHEQGHSSQFIVEGAMLLKSESGSLIPSLALNNLSKLDQLLENVWTNINLDDSSIHLSGLKISDALKNVPVIDIEKIDLHFVRQQKNDLNQTIKLLLNVDGFDSSLPISYSYERDEKATLYDKL
ncbi:MAG: hypothetical protein ACHQUC_10325, partial [Chlamydiales bacterium]